MFYNTVFDKWGFPLNSLISAEVVFKSNVYETKKIRLNFKVILDKPTTCSKVIRDVYLWEQKHKTTSTKTTIQQPQLRVFVFHIHQPPYFV